MSGKGLCYHMALIIIWSVIRNGGFVLPASYFPNLRNTCAIPFLFRCPYPTIPCRIPTSPTQSTYLLVTRSLLETLFAQLNKSLENDGALLLISKNRTEEIDPADLPVVPMTVLEGGEEVDVLTSGKLSVSFHAHRIPISDLPLTHSALCR